MRRTINSLSESSTTKNTNNFLKGSHHKSRLSLDVKSVKLDKVEVQNNYNILHLKKTSLKQKQHHEKKESNLRSIIYQSINKEKQKYETILSSDFQKIIQPIPTIFNQFGYENSKFLTIDSKMKRKFKKQQNKNKKINLIDSDQKPLQAIYCERKFEKFIQKSRSQKLKIKERPSLKVRHPEQSIFLHINILQKQKSQDCKIIKSNIESKTTRGLPLFHYSRHRTRTTLEQHMKTFLILEKISLNYDYEHCSFDKCKRKLKTGCIYLGALADHYTFLKQMPKKLREIVIQIILENKDTIYLETQLNIKHYLKFLQILVERDAEIEDLTIFVFMFLFGDQFNCTENYSGFQLNFTVCKKRLNLLSGSKDKHFLIEASILKKIKQSEYCAELLFQLLRKDKLILNEIINLIISK